MILLKHFQCFTFIAVNFPAAGTFIILSAVLDKTNHISKWIIKKNPNLMRKALCCFKALSQKCKALIRLPVLVTIFFQKSGYARALQILCQPFFTVYVD